MTADAMLLEAPSIREHMDDFALRAAYRIGPRTHSSISLRHDGYERVVASTGPRPARCDETEFAAGSGPCLTAMDLIQVVPVADVADETRWAAWQRQTSSEGFRSAVAVPAHVVEGADIAVNLYSEDVNPWTTEQLLAADAFAQEIARTVGLCLDVARLMKVADDRAARAEALDVVNQAVGATMATNGCSAVEALTLLRDASRHRNVDLRDVAEAVLEGLTGFPPLRG